MLELQDEWRYRYRHTKWHKSVEQIVLSDTVKMAAKLLYGISTPPALAMPDSCKISTNPVECYREYYRREKVALHKWTSRDVPYWL